MRNSRSCLNLEASNLLLNLRFRWHLLQCMLFAFQPPPSLPKMYEGLASTVAFDRSSGIAALCTENYCVQLYNLLNDRGISEVRIVAGSFPLSAVYEYSKLVSDSCKVNFLTNAFAGSSL